MRCRVLRIASLLCVMIILLGSSALSETYTTLRRGDKGNRVKTMQEALKACGYTITVDGDYGKKTQAIVKKFQKDNGLKVDGIAGNKTLTVLYGSAGQQEQAPSGLATVVTPLRSGGNAQQIKYLQQALKAAGYTIAVDGDYGKKTVAVVKQFQKEFGIQQDGIAGTLTLSLAYASAGMSSDALLQCAINQSGSAVSLRSKASNGSSSVISVPAGAAITLLFKQDSWYFVSYKTKTGFIPASVVKTLDYPSPLVNLARKFSTNTFANTSGGSSNLLGIAFTQLGFRGGTKSKPTLNGTGECGVYSKYGAYFNDAGESYCSYFVSWCARFAGISHSVINNARDVDGFFYDQQNRFTYFFTPTKTQTQGQKLNSSHKASRADYTPSIGDLIYFRWNNAKAATTFSHIGIVYDVDSTYVYTIEGSAGGAVDTRMYKRDEVTIMGYARPNY